jgi:hypothetical protein
MAGIALTQSVPSKLLANTGNACRAKWGAITVVVVAQPVLGKTMQVSTERSLGTVAGGLLGFVVVLAGRSMVDIDDLLFSGNTFYLGRIQVLLSSKQILGLCH